MFSLVRRFIKTGIAFLFAGLGIGAYMIVRREFYGIWPDRYLSSAHTHAVMFGFVLFLIFGVALWLFPRPAKEDRRYSPRLAALSYWILTIGTAGRIAGELAKSLYSLPALAWIIVAGGLAQIAGAALYFWIMWPRIRPLGSRARELDGERF